MPSWVGFDDSLVNSRCRWWSRAVAACTFTYLAFSIFLGCCRQTEFVLSSLSVWLLGVLRFYSPLHRRDVWCQLFDSFGPSAIYVTKTAQWHWANWSQATVCLTSTFWSGLQLYMYILLRYLNLSPLTQVVTSFGNKNKISERARSWEKLES